LLPLFPCLESSTERRRTRPYLHKYPPDIENQIEQTIPKSPDDRLRIPQSTGHGAIGIFYSLFYSFLISSHLRRFLPSPHMRLSIAAAHCLFQHIYDRKDKKLQSFRVQSESGAAFFRPALIDLQAAVRTCRSSIQPPM
jgi:hypothetical protein